MVEAQECGGRGRGDVVGWGIGEAAVGGAVGEHGGGGGEAVDFDAHEGKGGPAGEGPRAVAVSRCLAVRKGRKERGDVHSADGD